MNYYISNMPVLGADSLRSGNADVVILHQDRNGIITETGYLMNCGLAQVIIGISGATSFYTPNQAYNGGKRFVDIVCRHCPLFEIAGGCFPRVEAVVDGSVWSRIKLNFALLAAIMGNMSYLNKCQPLWRGVVVSSGLNSEAVYGLSRCIAKENAKDKLHLLNY